MYTLKSRIVYWLVPFCPSLFNKSRRIRTFIHRYALQTYKKDLGWWVQVGANDGGEWDSFANSIRSHQLQALLIEPVSYLFERLKKNYIDPKGKIVFEKLAIAAKEGVLTIKGIDPEKQEGLPGWASQISSLREEVMLGHGSLIPGIEKRLLCEEVQVMPLSKMLANHNIGEIAFLQIDTEGYDAVVLSSIDFSAVNIGLLSYEHKHLPEQEQLASLLLLQLNDFQYHVMKGDTIAWPKANKWMGEMVSKYFID